MIGEHVIERTFYISVPLGHVNVSPLPLSRRVGFYFYPGMELEVYRIFFEPWRIIYESCSIVTRVSCW